MAVGYQRPRVAVNRPRDFVSQLNSRAVEEFGCGGGRRAGRRGFYGDGCPRLGDRRSTPGSTASARP